MPSLLDACPDVLVLERYLSEDLEAQEASLVDSHVVDCVSCLDRLEDIVASRWESGDLPLPSEDEEVPSIAGYDVLGKIAAGGMGVVWRVRDTEFNRPLAVKVMKSTAAGKKSHRRRFLREAQISGQLAHPSIVPVHAMGTLADGRPYYTMKVVEGSTLASRLREAGTDDVDREELIQIFRQVCQAVAFAHRKGVVHRDLKPHNIMVGRHGEVQLMDWGLAKVLSDPDMNEEPFTQDSIVQTAESTMTEATRYGDMIGTLSYMPPEQARGLHERVGPRADVFALGAILCEILIGSPPYTGSTINEIHRKAVDADVEPALDRLTSSGVDPALVSLAQRCLSVDTSARPRDAGEVATAIEQYQQGVLKRLRDEQLARERDQVQATEDQKHLRLQAQWERRRRRWTLALSAAALTLIAMTSFGVITMQQRRAARHENQMLANKSLALIDTSLCRGDLTAANAELKRAAALLVDHDMDQRARLQELADALALAQTLDAVRGEYFTWSNGWFDCFTAIDRYRVDFADAGWPMLDSDPNELAHRIQASPITDRIIAGLDDWAWLTHRESLRTEEEAQRQTYIADRNRLLGIARQAAPDLGLNDELRDPNLWDQPDALLDVAEKVDPEDESAELLVLIGKLLPESAQFEFWKRCQAHHPRDFWLNIELGRSLLEQVTENIPADDPFGMNPVTRAFSESAFNTADNLDKARQSAGYYRAALSANPQRVGVHLDLAAALALSGDLDGAAELTRATTLIPPSSHVAVHEMAAAQHQRGLALRKLGNLTAAVDSFRSALSTDETYIIARWDLATTLQKLDRHDEAREHLEQLRLEAPDNTALTTMTLLHHGD